MHYKRLDCFCVDQSGHFCSATTGRQQSSCHVDISLFPCHLHGRYHIALSKLLCHSRCCCSALVTETCDSEVAILGIGAVIYKGGHSQSRVRGAILSLVALFLLFMVRP